MFNKAAAAVVLLGAHLVALSAYTVPGDDPIPRPVPSPHPATFVLSNQPEPKFVVAPPSGDADPTFPRRTVVDVPVEPETPQAIERVNDPLPPALWSGLGMLVLGAIFMGTRRVRRWLA